MNQRDEQALAILAYAIFASVAVTVAYKIIVAIIAMQ